MLPTNIWAHFYQHNWKKLMTKEQNINVKKLCLRVDRVEKGVVEHLYRSRQLKRK